MNIYFGKNLKELRRERNLTQENVADILGVSFQSVSKWERGESYPDITMLPVIASFFKVTVDELLGVNEAENEEKIQKYLYDAGCLTDHKAAYEIMKKAIAEFPGDFRLLDLYMRKLIASREDTPQEHMSILSEVRTIYDNIQANCTVDTIRISAKTCLASYYATLAKLENSGITAADVKEIIADMPHMRDSKDYLETCVFFSLNNSKEKAEHYAACRNTIDELLHILNATIYHYCFWEDFTPEFKIEAVKMMLAVQNMFNDDGNYGESWRLVMYNYGHLGNLYFTLGDNKKALESLRKAAETAKQFDELPQISVRHSFLFDGAEFDKNTLGSTHVACSRMKFLMTERYPLSDEFKASDEFKEILEILD